MTERMYPNSMAFTATAPSNIAFVKYWGKRNQDLQWPANDSLSMTLSQCQTITSARKILGNEDIFHFEGRVIRSGDTPNHKVFRHLQRVKAELKIFDTLEVSSSNLFPTACGIASSASGFAALTLAATAALLGEHRLDELAILGMPRQKLAHLARMGSGSAGRSLHGGYVLWQAGESPETQQISQVTTASHWDLSDVVVIFSSNSKHTSSSDAHKAAWGSPLFPVRLAGITQRIERVVSALQEKNIEKLGLEIENDALEMHSVAMTGSPATNYFTEDTARFIAWVRDQRSAGNLPAWFTIDAGPNVHLICETADVAAVTDKLKASWPNLRLIIDQVGLGPTLSKGQWAENPGEVRDV